MQTQIILLLFTFLANVSASNQHLICKSINDVFSENTDRHGNSMNSTAHRSGSQGKPGKMGPVGPRGYPGQRGTKGEPGYVNYNNISDIVESKVCEGLTRVATSLNELKTDIQDLRQNLIDQLNCIGSDFLFNGTCYTTPHLSASQDLNRASAAEACLDADAELAEIHDKPQQLALEHFIRGRIPATVTNFYLWIGMRYSSDSRAVRYRSGKEIVMGQLLWWPGHPGSGKFMALGVRRSGGDGVFDSNDTNLYGVICQRKI